MRRHLTSFRIIILLTFAFLLSVLCFLRRSPPDQDGNAESTPAVEILIPKTIHQLLISMPKNSMSQFKPNSHGTSWQRSGWKIEYWSETACAELANELDARFSETFQQLPLAVLRSDFCRYMVLYARGGIYNDLDVHLMKALPWEVMGPSKGKDDGPPSLIIGLEGDATSKGLPSSPQFVQWTMASAPFHPVLRDTLAQIANRTAEFLRQQGDGDPDIMNWTGPSVWTDSIVAYLNCTEGQLRQLRNLKEAVRYDDVLILPKRAFAVIQGEDHSSPDILVKHYFSGTWKHQQSWISKIFPRLK